MESNPQILLIHINIFIYSLSYWLIQPIFPFLSKNLGADPILFGYLQTIISLLQLLGGPIIGRLCDSYGARLALVLCQIGSFMHYCLLGFANCLELLFISQFPMVLMHSMHCAQVAISLSSTEKNRAKQLGRLSLSYGTGMVLGSFCGGSLSKAFGNSSVILLSAFLTLMIIPMNFIYLPNFRIESEYSKDESQLSKNESKLSKNETSMNLKRVFKVMSFQEVRNLVMINVALGLGLGVYTKSFSQVLQIKFLLSSQDIGRVLSFGALISVFVNTFLVGYITERISEAKLQKIAVIVISVSLAIYSQISSIVLLLFLSIPLSTAMTIVYTIYSSRMSKAVAANDTGTSIGLCHATRGLCGVLSPVVAGYLLQNMHSSAIGIFGVTMAWIALALIYLLDNNDTKQNIRKKTI